VTLPIALGTAIILQKNSATRENTALDTQSAKAVADPRKHVLVSAHT
jgi:hypothetical protein